MILDDKIAFNLIVELMQIRNEPHTLKHTQEWINEKGLEEVFHLVVHMHTDITENPLEFPYDCKDQEG